MKKETASKIETALKAAKNLLEDADVLMQDEIDDLNDDENGENPTLIELSDASENVDVAMDRVDSALENINNIEKED